jgi:nicotinamide phosphoribosyltransferase
MTNLNYKQVAEAAFIKHLICNVYPEGVVSLVSDTFDFWGLVSEVLPRLKDTILNRNGKIVIRPDSGDPVDIICGTRVQFGVGDAPEEKGLIECLWDIFGGEINEKGYKVLDPHIGAIYGDSITYRRAAEILERLEHKGFSSDNIVLGIGSYTFQYVTRDTHGMAVKSTHAVINGESVPIFKEPKTDDGTKKSAKGYLMVVPKDGEFALVDQVSQEREEGGCLQTVFLNGELKIRTTLESIRRRTAI